MTGKTVSHYKISDKLGEGGMGVVYKAEDINLERSVALKFLPPHLSNQEEDKKRFIREAKAASVLEHNNICTIHEISEAEDGQLFIVMSYLEGKTLREKIDTAPLKVEEAVDISIQIAEGLKFAHSKGIIHRDIKPANIMLTTDGTVKIMDFGLAKTGSSTKLTQMGTTLGTFSYMSPEQSQGREVDQRADIWSLGASLFELLTGQLPFKGDYEQAVIYSILNQEPEPLTSLRSNIPLELERIVQKLLAKDPDERYQSMTDVLVDLRTLQKKSASGISVSSVQQVPAKKQRSYIKWMAAAVIPLLVMLVLFLIFYGEPSDSSIGSIAVLPLSNLSNDAEQEYFVEGMTDALITELSKVSALKVISRTSILKYRKTEKSLPEIARELGVDGIVEGSVLQVGDHVRITAQLIEAATDQHIWANSFDYEMKNILSLHSEVASRIAGSINLNLSTEQGKGSMDKKEINPESYAAYLQGKYLLDKLALSEVQKSIDLFKEAVKLDPGYELPYVGLADAYLTMSHFYPDNGVNLEISEEYLSKALSINENSADAHFTRAKIEYLEHWNWEAGNKELKHVLQINPNHADALSLSGGYKIINGQTEEGISEMKRAAELDPVSHMANCNYAWGLYSTDKYSEAISVSKRLIEMGDYCFMENMWIGWSYGKLGEIDSSISEMENLPERTANWPPRVSTLAYDFAVSGETEKAQTLLNRLLQMSKLRPVDPYFVAIVYTGMRNNPAALEWIRKGIAAKSFFTPQVLVDPRFEDLRRTPEFAEVKNTFMQITRADM